VTHLKADTNPITAVGAPEAGDALSSRRSKSRQRGDRHRARRRRNDLVRWDGRYGYDAVVLAMLVLRGLVADADASDLAKVNRAVTQLLFNEAYKDAPSRCPRLWDDP
jgi:hypothetical protein